MASHIVECPCLRPRRERIFAVESFCSAEDLQKVPADLRSSIWKQMADAGIKYTPSNTFSYHEQVFDSTSIVGAVPPSYGWNGGEIGSDPYFSMARGNASVPAMEMTEWFDTNYHFIVPVLGPDVNFYYASHRAVDEYKEAKAAADLKGSDHEEHKVDEADHGDQQHKEEIMEDKIPGEHAHDGEKTEEKKMGKRVLPEEAYDNGEKKKKLKRMGKKIMRMGKKIMRMGNRVLKPAVVIGHLIAILLELIIGV